MSEPNCNTQPEEEEAAEAKEEEEDEQQQRRAGPEQAKEHITEYTAVRILKEGQDEQLIR